MKTIKQASYIAFVAIVFITLLSAIGDLIAGPLWLELASHFKVQYFCLGLILFGIVLLSQCPKSLIIASCLCLVVILAGILPWYLPQHMSQAVAEANQSLPLRIINSNIFAPNRNYDKVISFVRAEKPDVAIFIEVDDTWVERLDVLKDILPYSPKFSQTRDLGIAVFSRYPLENISINYFDTDTLSRQVKRSSILADLEMPGQTISLIATHPVAPLKPKAFASRNLQLEGIAKYIQTLKHPVVMAGDLNITMWSPYYQKFISNSGLHNAREGFGILPTWPTDKAQSRLVARVAKLVAIPIDHCLVSPAIAVQNIRTGPNVDSDHLPLVTDLLVPIIR